MAQLIQRPKIELTVGLILSEEEARALDALVGYGDDAFVEHFYAKLGKHYMEPHEAGLRSLFKSVRDIMPGVLGRTDDARRVFTGEKEARSPGGAVIAALRKRCQQEIEAEEQNGVHGGGSGPNLARELTKLLVG